MKRAKPDGLKQATKIMAAFVYNTAMRDEAAEEEGTWSEGCCFDPALIYGPLPS